MKKRKNPGYLLSTITNKNIDKLIATYNVEYGNDVCNEVAFYRNQPDLKSAIEVAAKAITKGGKKHDHQWRLSNETLEAYCEILISQIKTISQCQNFEEIIDVTTKAKIDGIGELAIYDTAHRIGIYLGIHPEKVYLHRGTREGAKNLGLSVNKSFLEMSDLPDELKKLQAQDIENLLCVYKDRLLTI